MIFGLPAVRDSSPTIKFNYGHLTFSERIPLGLPCLIFLTCIGPQAHYLFGLTFAPRRRQKPLCHIIGLRIAPAVQFGKFFTNDCQGDQFIHTASGLFTPPENATA